MSEQVTSLLDRPVAQLTVRQLESLITAVVQRTVRRELRRDYYVNERGVKVLYAEDKATPIYLAKLQQDYEAIQQGEVELASGEAVAQELRDLGLKGGGCGGGTLRCE